MSYAICIYHTLPTSRNQSHIHKHFVKKTGKEESYHVYNQRRIKYFEFAYEFNPCELIELDLNKLQM